MSSWGVQWPRGAGTTVDPHHSFSLFPSCPWSQCGLKKTNRNVASRPDWWCGTSYLPCRLGLVGPPSHQLPRPDRKIATWWRWHNRRNKWQSNLFRAHCSPFQGITYLAPAHNERWIFNQMSKLVWTCHFNVKGNPSKSCNSSCKCQSVKAVGDRGAGKQTKVCGKSSVEKVNLSFFTASFQVYNQLH